MKLGMKIFKAVLIGGAGASVLAAMVSCTKGSSITGGDEASTGGLAVNVTKVYPTLEGPTWSPIISGGRYYIKGTRLTLFGSCDRGIASIRVREDAAPDFPETATCDSNGTFTWTKTDFVGEDDKPLTITAYDATGTILAGVEDTVLVRVDDVAPAQLVFTDPDPAFYTYPTAYPHMAATGNFTIQGTCAADVAYIITDGSVTIPVVGACATWSYGITIGQGQSLDFHFTGYDLAGNAATMATQKILYSPGLDVPYASYHGGGRITGTASFSMEATIGWDAGTTLSTVPIAPNQFTLHTGFNNVINRDRATVNDYADF